MKTSLTLRNWIILLGFLLLTLAACQTKTTTESGSTDSVAADETASQVDRLQPDTLVQSAAASTSSSATTSPGNADRMRQWTGTYSGTLPCADCEGIKTSLVLNADGTYTMQEAYLGKGDNNPRQSTGQWKPSDDGINLELDYARPDEIIRFRPAEGNIIKMLGRDGAEIASKLNYSLTKQ